MPVSSVRQPRPVLGLARGVIHPQLLWPVANPEARARHPATAAPRGGVGSGWPLPPGHAGTEDGGFGVSLSPGGLCRQGRAGIACLQPLRGLPASLAGVETWRQRHGGSRRGDGWGGNGAEFPGSPCWEPAPDVIALPAVFSLSLSSVNWSVDHAGNRNNLPASKPLLPPFLAALAHRARVVWADGRAHRCRDGRCPSLGEALWRQGRHAVHSRGTPAQWMAETGGFGILPASPATPAALRKAAGELPVRSGVPCPPPCPRELPGSRAGGLALSQLTALEN